MLAPNFGDATGESVSVRSSWKMTADTADSEAQTEPIEVSHQRTQEPRTKEILIQTEPPEAASAPLVRGGFQSSASLDSFLLQCTPLLEDQLHRNVATKAFEGHDVSWTEQACSLPALLSAPPSSPPDYSCLKANGSQAHASPSQRNRQLRSTPYAMPTETS